MKSLKFIKDISLIFSLIRERESCKVHSKFVDSNEYKYHFTKASLLLFRVIFITLLILGMSGCAIENLVPKPDEEDVDYDTLSSTTPYASLEELESLTNLYKEVVYWKGMKIFVLTELQNFRKEEGWYAGHKLSERPIVI